MRLSTILLAAGTLFAGAAWTQQEPLKDDLILWLDFAEPGEDTFACRATGELCRVTGGVHTQHGAAVVSQFGSLSVPGFTGADALESLTLSAWIAPSAHPGSYQTLLYKGLRRGAAQQEIQFMLSLWEGRPEFKFKDAEGRWQGIMRNGEQFTIPGGEPVGVGDVPVVAAKRWSHVAATFDRGLVCLYLDGEKVLSATAPVEHLTVNQQPLTIGEAHADGGGRAYLFHGLMDDVRIYRRALSEEDLRGLYALERADKSRDALDIVRPLPEGYDPEFGTKLPLVAAYEAALPTPRDGSAAPEAQVRAHGGVPTLHIDGRPVTTMAMMPEPYVSDEQIALSCRDFAAAGHELYSEIFWSWMTPGQGCFGWWTGPGEYDFDRIDARIRAIIAANPRALIMPRIKLNPPKWWLDAHPDEITREADGKLGQQVSLASELWTETYERMLRDVVGHMESSDYRGHIFGYHPAGGGSSEWFWWGSSGHVDFSPAAIARWRRWLGERYGGDVVRLREAWGDGNAGFEADPPGPEQHAAAADGMFRDPVKGRRVVDYREFLSDMVSSNIIHSCRVVKEVTGGKKIAGVFYGYSLYCLKTDGFQGLREVLASPHVDFLAAPTAYDRRRGGEAGSFISAYGGSYRLHNKLYFDEVDTRTHLYPGFESYRTDNLSETQAVLQRAAGYSLTRGTSLWWFLLAGNATFHQAEVMDTVAAMKRACDDALAGGREQVAQVAVFADERAMHTCNGNDRLHTMLCRETVDELARMGAPFDLYLLSDIADANLPQYKLYVFLNAFEVDDGLRRRIDAVVRGAGKTAAWVYAPGYVTPQGFDPKGPSTLTGITIKRHVGGLNDELSIAAPEHPIVAAYPQPRRTPVAIAPAFVVDDPDATVLGTTAGLPTLAVKEQDGWRSVYSLLPLDRGLLLGLCRYAGVHVYSETLDPFSASAGYLMLHTATEGTKRLKLHEPAEVTELTEGRELGKGLEAIEEQLPAGVTRVYRLGR